MTIERTLAAAGDGPILIALSGGGDSVALLHKMAASVGAARLHAIVVDHALREGSAADAARAAGFAETLGVAAEVRTLSWAAHQKRSQETARRQRYAALCDAARTHGARVIAVAHSADDQAETVFMRAASGSAWRGLAGMAEIAPAPVWPEGRGIVLARPLLAVRRAALRAFLVARGAEWIEDPANANPAFERVRIRARLAALELGGFDPLRLTRFAASLRTLADQVDVEALALVRRAAHFDGPEIIIEMREWRAPDETRLRALSALIAAVAGAERAAEAPALARLEARVADASFRGAALGGARVRRVAETLRLTRDPGAVEGRAGVAAQASLDLAAREELVWDGRLAIKAAKALRLSPSADEPRIIDNDSVMTLSEAAAHGLADAHWLTEQHLIHQLSPLSTTNLSF